jgi:hypothetical protein
MMRDPVNVHIPEEALSNCKATVQEFTKSRKEFKELGGYLIGRYDGNFRVSQFILDEDSESTTTRIKLSFDCYEKVEQLLEKNSALSYIGTWHVHPGKSKPHYSLTDKSTLFLEKLILKTDNPSEYHCPRIHLIFSEDLEEISAYTMQVQLDAQIADYWTASQNIQSEDLDRLKVIIETTQEAKGEFESALKKPLPIILEDAMAHLGQAREDLDYLMMKLIDICEFMEIRTTLQGDRKRFEKELNSLIKKGETLGIFYLVDDDTIGLSEYHPTEIQGYFDSGMLIGFWRHYKIPDPPLTFQKIFLANFYKKIEENRFVYLKSTPNGLQYFYVEHPDFQGITFEEITIMRDEIE